MGDQTRGASANAISQDDLRVVQIIENMGLPAWRKVYDAAQLEIPIESGGLEVATGWIPCEPLVVIADSLPNEEKRLDRAIAYYEMHIARLRERRKQLRQEHGFNLFAVAARFAEGY